MGKNETIEEKDVEARILQAAKDVFTRKGYAAASMREIAGTAGVNKGLLHYYKWDKRKLFQMVFDEAFDQFATRANEIFQADLPLIKKIEAFVESYLDILHNNPYMPAFVISELNLHPEDFVNNLLKRKNRPEPARLLVQLQLEAQAGRIRAVNPFHFFLNMLSLCVFPFLARPMITGLLGLDDETYRQLLKQRKDEIVALLQQQLKPE